jgi:hypothetical protein
MTTLLSLPTSNACWQMITRRIRVGLELEKSFGSFSDMRQREYDGPSFYLAKSNRDVLKKCPWCCSTPGLTFAYVKILCHIAGGVHFNRAQILQVEPGFCSGSSIMIVLSLLCSRPSSMPPTRMGRNLHPRSSRRCEPDCGRCGLHLDCHHSGLQSS